MGILSKFFKPTEKVRARDVLREIPASFLKVAKTTGSFFGGIGKSAVEDLVIQPGVRTAQTIAEAPDIGRILIGKVPKKLSGPSDEDVEVDIPVLGKFKISKQKTGKKGALQIAGQVAKQASWLYTPGAGKASIVAPTLTGAFLQGAKAGAVGAGLYSSGEALQRENPTLTSVLKEAAVGTAVGGAVGGGLGLLGAALSKQNPKVILSQQRPNHQIEIEKLLNNGDDEGAKKLINALPDRDPYKLSMLDFLKQRDLPVQKLPHQTEVEKFLLKGEFQKARSIVNGLPATDPSKNALDAIVSGYEKQTGFISLFSSNVPEKVNPPPNPLIEKIRGALKTALPLRGQQEAIYSAERSKRLGAALGVGGKGEEKFFSQLGQLKGEIPKVEFESIRSKISGDDIIQLFDMIDQSPKLRGYDYITAKSGLEKLIGVRGVSVPNESELKLLQTVYGKDLITDILAKRPLIQKLTENLIEVGNLPRSLMATADLSAPLRQGIFLAPSHPIIFGKDFGSMFKQFASQGGFDSAQAEISNRATHRLMQENRLALTDMGLGFSNREEAFMSHFAERIPLFGKLAKASNRAYTGFLNKLRADIFDDFVRNGIKSGSIKDPKFLRDAAKFINSATGRGDLGKLSRYGPALNATFFAPKLIKSRLDLLNPLFYAKLQPAVRKEALKSLLAFSSTALSVLGLAKLNGAEVSGDPTNADFGKIKVGNTRYDILGGFQQYIRLGAQLITGKVTSSTTGKKITLGEGYKPLTRSDVLARFVGAKENPLLSFVSGLFSGKDSLGKDIDIPTEIISRNIPLVIQDIYDLYQERGPAGIAMGIPAIFGTGVQTYGRQEIKQGKNALGKDDIQITDVPALPDVIRKKLFGPTGVKPSAGYSIETFYDQMLKLSKDEQVQTFEAINKANPKLADKLRTVDKERDLGITVDDQTLKAKGVENGDRAMAIAEEIQKLKTKEERAAKWEEYVRKRIITDEVAKQLKELLK